MQDYSSAAGKRLTCAHCGMVHDTTCPRIKAIEYHHDGSTKRIEFHGPAATPLFSADKIRIT